MKGRHLLFLIALYGYSHTPATADTLDNARALFNFAETTYPELLQPSAPAIQELQGFYIRHYTATDIYLGVQGDKIYAYGPQLGPSVVYVGKLEDLISIADRDISDTILTNRRAECSYYAENSFAAVRDIQRNILFNGSIRITVDGTDCVITTNSVPNHDFNDNTAAFATAVAVVNAEFRIPTAPGFAASTTPISLQTDNAVMLNGVKLDLLAAACFGVGDEKIGCNDINQPWRFDPMSPKNQFGTDLHNAHTQPDGAYHYHGNPMALFTQQASVESPVVGFAADGFPIYGSYIDDGGQIRAVASSYRLKSGTRPSGSGNPGGNYDGTYVDDYEYVANLGDLDECNGMMWKGAYGYYVVDTYPWVLACFKGTPDTSFNKTGGGTGNQGGPPPPPGL